MACYNLFNWLIKFSQNDAPCELRATYKSHCTQTTHMSRVLPAQRDIILSFARRGRLEVARSGVPGPINFYELPLSLA